VLPALISSFFFFFFFTVASFMIMLHQLVAYLLSRRTRFISLTPSLANRSYQPTSPYNPAAISRLPIALNRTTAAASAKFNNTSLSAFPKHNE
jgi:hypothetical protein